MTTDDAPRPALDAAALERLREGYSPEPPPLPCHAPADLEQRGTDDAGWRRWYCRVCGFVRMTAPGDPDVLALLTAYDAAAARADALAGRIESALTLLGGVEARIADARDMVEAGDDEEAEWWSDTLALVGDGIAALAPAAGEGSDLGSQHRAPQSCGGGSE